MLRRHSFMLLLQRSCIARRFMLRRPLSALVLVTAVTTVTTVATIMGTMGITATVVGKVGGTQGTLTRRKLRAGFLFLETAWN